MDNGYPDLAHRMLEGTQGRLTLLHPFHGHIWMILAGRNEVSSDAPCVRFEAQQRRNAYKKTA